MLEILAFPLLMGGAVLWQMRKGRKTNHRMMIEQMFKNIGLGINEKANNGQVFSRYPQFKGKDENRWGTCFRFVLPVGMSFREVMKKIPLDVIIEDTINRDVDIKSGGGRNMEINVYGQRLPTFVPYKEEMLKICKGWKVVIGVNHKEIILHDFNTIPHMIIGGMTRYGKSVIMKLLITQLILLRGEDVRFHLFDLKGGLAFNRFKRVKPQVDSVSRDLKESLRNLKNIQSRIKKRQLYFEEKGYEDIGEALANGEYFNREIIIVDEASVLAPKDKSDQDKKKCHEILEFIAQVSGGLGYNLIMCSQYPTGDILPRQVKQNADAKISFRLGTDIASKVILDEPGADEIPHGYKGRAIYKTDQKQMIQVPFMSNEMIDALIEPFKKEVEEDESELAEEDREGGGDTADNRQAGVHNEEPDSSNSQPWF